MFARPALVLTLVSLLAPAAGAAPWSIGAAVQYDRAKLAFDPDEGLETSPHLFTGFGLELQAPLASRLSLVLAPAWHARGGRVNAVGDSEELRARLRFVELPLWLRLDLATGRLRPYLLAGAGFELRRSARVQTFVDGRLIEENDIADETRSSDASVLLGAGLGGPLASGKGQVFVEGAYAWGLRDVNRAVPHETTVHLRGFQFRAGLRFALGGTVH